MSVNRDRAAAGLPPYPEVAANAASTQPLPIVNYANLPYVDTAVRIYHGHISGAKVLPDGRLLVWNVYNPRPLPEDGI